MVGEVSIIASEEKIPIMIDQEIPFAVVFFQNRINKIADRLADAAIAKAQPTKKDTFIPLKAIPSTIAKIPTPNAASLPTNTFFSSLSFLLKYPSIKSRAIAPDEATISP